MDHCFDLDSQQDGRLATIVETGYRLMWAWGEWVSPKDAARARPTDWHCFADSGDSVRVWRALEATGSTRLAAGENAVVFVPNTR